MSDLQHGLSCPVSPLWEEKWHLLATSLLRETPLSGCLRGPDWHAWLPDVFFLLLPLPRSPLGACPHVCPHGSLLFLSFLVADQKETATPCIEAKTVDAQESRCAAQVSSLRRAGLGSPFCPNRAYEIF